VNPQGSAVLLQLERVPSTQDLLHDLAGDGAPHGSAVAAAEQTAGRGSRGQTWASPRGGLWLSVLCRPSDEAAVAVMSLRVALAVAGTLEAAVPGLRLGIKWPNDLLVGGLKVGGILCEARWQGAAPAWVAVGLGLNVTNPIPAALDAMATSLLHHAPGLEPAALVAPMVRTITEAGACHGALTDAELEEFRSRDVLRGRRVTGPVAGVVEGPARGGELRVRLPSGVVSLLRSGPVTLQ
jgi:BirA family biotin operon repressor/biotin-[acetyl-CoA-carboxylase] ligase